jgi:Anaphase promoting complex subunit 8 / Cdc23
MTDDSFLFGEEQSNALSPEVAQELQERLSEAAIKCSERCLYQSAKW